MTIEQALNLLSRTASAAHAAGATTDADLNAARNAVTVLAEAIKPKDRTPPAPHPADPTPPYSG